MPAEGKSGFSLLPSSSSLIHFERFELDVRNSQLRRGGVPVDLSPQAFKVLVMLAERPDQLVTRREIKDALWPGELYGDFDSRLNFTVKKLRESLGDSAEQPRYVQTVRNAGYMFVAPVRTMRTTQGISSRRGDNQVDSSGVVGRLQVELGNTTRNPAPQGKFRFVQSALFVVAIAVAASAVAFGGFGLRLRPGVRHESGAEIGQTVVDGVPQISSVSPIIAQARQRIVIRGRGFGLHVPYSHTDSPFLAIRDETGDWAAGRMVPHNWDEVMLDVESWANDEIVLTGFSGDYGLKGWKLTSGDKLEVRIWNPESGLGPARFLLVVGPADPPK